MLVRLNQDPHHQQRAHDAQYKAVTQLTHTTSLLHPHTQTCVSTVAFNQLTIVGRSAACAQVRLFLRMPTYNPWIKHASQPRTAHDGDDTSVLLGGLGFACPQS